jgi:ferric-dicitrate binding protein FerR (iron transport regulator)
VTGVFRVGETDAFVRALNDAFGVRAEQTNGEIVLRPEAGAVKN